MADARNQHLDRVPFWLFDRGVLWPVRRPVESYDRFLKLMEVAGEVDWRLPLAPTLAESTGQRIGLILTLRRSDVELDRAPRAHSVPG